MKQTRRGFVKKMIGGMVVLYSVPFTIGCSGIIRSKIDNGLSFSDDNIPGIDKNRAAILYYASLAPSGHNAQPWFVKINSDSQWIVGGDPKRRLPAVDPDNRALLMGIGAFLENLSLAARVYGYDPAIEIIAEDAFEPNIARVTLQPARPFDYALSRLEKRRTVRNGLLPLELEQDDIQALTADPDGTVFYFPRNGSRHAECIEEAQVEAYRIQTHRAEASVELKAWFRLSNEDAQKYRDGLTTEGMEISGIKGWYMRNFMKPEDMTSDFSKKMSIAMNEELVKQGAGWFVISTKSNQVDDIIEAGRKYERMALIARERKIALAPMTQLLEEKTGRDAIASRHGSDINPQMVVRAGYVKSYPDPVSLRRPVNWFTSA